jgi:hypothetical protein
MYAAYNVNYTACNSSFSQKFEAPHQGLQGGGVGRVIVHHVSNRNLGFNKKAWELKLYAKSNLINLYKI